MLWLVDTGASVTCMRRQAFERLDRSLMTQLEMSKTFSITGATGHDFDLVGAFDMPIRIANRTYRFPVIVTEQLQVEAIMGIDFLKAHVAKIDPAAGRLIMRNTGKLESIADDSLIEEEYEVKACAGAHLAPRQAAWIKCQAPVQAFSVGMVESEFMVLESALLNVKPDRSFRVLVHNPDTEPLEIQRGQHVGVLGEDRQIMQEQIAKIAGVQDLKTFLIHRIKIARLAVGKDVFVVFGDLAGGEPLVFPAINQGRKIARRPAFSVDVFRFKDLLDQPDLVVGI